MILKTILIIILSFIGWEISNIREQFEIMNNRQNLEAEYYGRDMKEYADTLIQVMPLMEEKKQ